MRVSACDERTASIPGEAHELTSLMIRNIPNNISRSGLISLFNSFGFRACVDFLYLPIDFDRRANLGYAFLNFVNGMEASRFMDVFNGFSAWPGHLTSKKVISVQWTTGLQGLEAHVARYRNTPLMHGSVPEECRPVMLQHGEQVPFPAPTKTLRKPRLASGPKRRKTSQA
jgi:hypothetical protein